MLQNIRSFLILLFAVSIGCNQSSEPVDDVLASFGNETLTLADFDRFLLEHAQENRVMPQGSESAAWIEDKLRRMAIERLLMNSEEMKSQLASPEHQARQLLAQFKELNQALQVEIGKEIEPTDDAISAKTQILVESLSVEPVLDLQHIFFRIDRGDAAEVKARANRVLQQAKAGHDFTDLVRQHSDSANAKEGGYIRNVYPSSMDGKVAVILEKLEEGSFSEILESRTGLHLFRLIRRLEAQAPDMEKLHKRAKAALQRERFPEHMKTLVQQLHERIPVNTEQDTWQIGSFSLKKPVHEAMVKALGLGPEQAKPVIVEMALLSQEAQDRQLTPPQLKEKLERAEHLFAMQLLFNRAYEDLETLLPPERIKAFYDAQPSLFAQPEEVSVSLIFVPQGRDSFATQTSLEKKVAALRNGGSFSQLAKEISKGPQAESGGNLGFNALQTYQQYGPSVANAIPQLGVGDISDPIYCTDRILSQNPNLLRGGFAIVKIDDRKPVKERRFEEAIDDVRTVYAKQYRQDLDLEIRNKLLAEADFKIVRLPTLKELVQ